VLNFSIVVVFHDYGIVCGSAIVGRSGDHDHVMSYLSVGETIHCGGGRVVVSDFYQRIFHDGDHHSQLHDHVWHLVVSGDRNLASNDLYDHDNRIVLVLLVVHVADIVAVVDFHDYNRVVDKMEAAVKNQPYYRMAVRAVVVCSFGAELLGFALISVRNHRAQKWISQICVELS